MTRKEAIKNIEQLLRWYVKEEPMSETMYKREAVKVAIEALEQEPCEDAVSRKEVLEYIEYSCADLESACENDEVCHDIKSMPSVRPQKRGSWIERFNEDERWLMCTECRKDSDKAHNFCPNCGADMRGERAHDKRREVF